MARRPPPSTVEVVVTDGVDQVAIVTGRDTAHALAVALHVFHDDPRHTLSPKLLDLLVALDRKLIGAA